jgi:hypothetical protein
MTTRLDELVEPIVIIRAAVCGSHHHDDCTGCTGSRSMNDSQLDQMRDAIAALREALETVALIGANHREYLSDRAIWEEMEQAALSCLTQWQQANGGSEGHG